MLRNLSLCRCRAGGLPLLACLVLAALPSAARADAEDPVPRLAGPVLRGPADAQLGAASYAVVFGEGGRVAHVELALPLSSAAGGEAQVAFGVRGVWQLLAWADGTPVAVEDAASAMPGGGPFDRQFLVRLPLAPGAPVQLLVRALGDTQGSEREPSLTYPQATFVLNRLLEAPRARSVEIQPGTAGAGELRLRVETVPPQWPEAPVAGEMTEENGRWVLEGPVVADLAVPIEVAAIEGEYAAPRNWGITFGIGAAVDWARLYGVVGCNDDPPPAAGESCVSERNGWYSPDAGDPASRVWFRGAFAYTFDPHWLFEVGVEGDFAGALELPLVFTWYPQDGSPGLYDIFGDYHFILGLAVQLINNRMPEDHGFDPRPFVRLGAGVRFLLVTLDLVYELAPPVGDWDGRYGGLQHKILITLPFRF